MILKYGTNRNLPSVRNLTTKLKRQLSSASTVPSTDHVQSPRHVEFHSERKKLVGIDGKLLQLLPELDSSTFKDHLVIPQLGWRSFFSTEPVKYTPKYTMLYKEYLPGSLAAHNYPLGVLPREYSARVPGDLYVTPYTLDNINYSMINGKRVRMSLSPGVKVNGQIPLLHALYGKANVVLLFSGQPPTGDSNAAMLWKNSIKSNIEALLVLYNPCSMALKWLYARYVRTLASNVVEAAKFYSISTRLGIQNIMDLHQYREQLPSVLVVDREGYIRWHAIGKPTREALALLQYSLDTIDRM